MTLKVLVADDEELERRALRHILGDTRGPGGETIEVIEAVNGHEAVALAAAGRPDLAFLDIRMPGCDGIEAARRLRESMPDLPIVFLTAHDSFTYARDALRLRVEDFLLKPATAEEVRASLAAAFSASSPGEAGAGLRGMVDWLAGEIRTGLAAGRVDGEKLRRWLEYGGRGTEPLAALAFRIDGGRDGGREGDRDSGRAGFLPAGIADLAERHFGDRTSIAGVSPSEGLCMLASTPDPGEGGWAGDPGAAVMAFMRVALDRFGVTLAAGLAILRTGESFPLQELARTARRAAAVSGGPRPLLILNLGPGGPGGPGGPDIPTLPGPGARTAARALELMDARHAEDLSLDLIAAEVGVSPSHLSRLLARSAGLGFADCLARLRVEKARFLLASDSISVKEVAAIVGFRDPAYFARVFRRQTGASPNGYRERLMGTEQGGRQ